MKTQTQKLCWIFSPLHIHFIFIILWLSKCDCQSHVAVCLFPDFHVVIQPSRSSARASILHTNNSSTDVYMVDIHLYALIHTLGYYLHSELVCVSVPGTCGAMCSGFIWVYTLSRCLGQKVIQRVGDKKGADIRVSSFLSAPGITLSEHGWAASAAACQCVCMCLCARVLPHSLLQGATDIIATNCKTRGSLAFTHSPSLTHSLSPAHFLSLSHFQIWKTSEAGKV